MDQSASSHQPLPHHNRQGRDRRLHDIARRLGCDLPGHWLSPYHAIEFSLRAPGLPAARAQLDDILQDTAIDGAILPASGRRKKLLAADMDATIILEETLDELADELGLGPQIRQLTERAMRGDMAFDAALDARMALLEGVEITHAQRIVARRTHIRSGARELVCVMQAKAGARCLLVTGGFLHFARPVADALGFDSVCANIPGQAKGRLDGTIVSDIVDGARKDAFLRAAAREARIELCECLAIGDGANDIAMVTSAGLGVAIGGKPALNAVADVKIRHNDLRALLYVQGYSDSEISATGAGTPATPHKVTGHSPTDHSRR